MVPTLVAIDPGKHASGIAVFRDRVLEAVYYTKDTDVLSWLFAPDVRVIVEVPQVYSYERSKGDPNDLVDLAFAAGRMTRDFEHVDVVRPKQWKGQLPKDVHHQRVMAKLVQPECDVIHRAQVAQSKLHNVLDAVGLGLWKLGR